ncbi:hypothetical protein [Streptomyces hirsutus]|uniref:hypothetical protein n=1 Tax=Streptomyces hirsutus TaxID=35620 RepID=UPI0036ACB745
MAAASRVASGYGPRAATARATCAVSSGTCGHGRDCIDIQHPTRNLNGKTIATLANEPSHRTARN